jgi:hypothetical protein
MRRLTACITRRPAGRRAWIGKAVDTRRREKSQRQGGRVYALLGGCGARLTVSLWV